MGPDWADACRTKAEELESIRKQIVHLTSTMSSVNYQMDAWERRLRELTGEGSPSTVRMLPKQKVTFKPRQKLLERVKDIEKESHGRRFRSSRQDECESHSISKLARDFIDHAWEEGGKMDKGNYIQKSDKQRRLQQTEKAASNGMFSMHDSEYCEEESRMSNQPLSEIKSKSVKDTSIISGIEDSESGQHDLKEGVKDKEATLQDIQKPLVQREDSSLSNFVSNKPSTSAPKSSGINKEFKKLFKMLDTEVERRKKERESKEEDEEKQKAQKLRRAYSHIPTHSSGLYNEFEELFRLLDNQQINNTRRAEQINIMSELNDVISAVQLGSPLMCSECSLGCDMHTNSGGNDDFGSDRNDENKSQSANTDIYSENIEEKLKKRCTNIDDSNINYSSSVCPVFALKSNITALLTKAALTESNGNESSNAVQKVHWAEELQKTYSVSRTENRNKRRCKKKDSRGFPDITDAGYIQSNLNNFPHSSDERSQKNLQLHIKDVLIELPPIPNDLARRRDNAAGMQNELCGWLGQLAEDYPEPKDPMPSPRDGYEHLYMDQRNYRKQSFCLPAVQRFKGKKLTKNQILRKPKVEEIPCEGKSELSDDNVVNPQTDSDDNDVNYMEERKYFREESDENEIEDVCAKLNFVELETPPFQTIKHKEFSALPPIKGIRDS
ncbi:hypothetical protein FSP39_014460 [Pinctada imbricata]|uniref:Uncharacterized protein n=1 Tax=Pinctada imbricata TaxID=66713 RepID=A0AA89C1T7_PINIB|nr:hypothetical protein FSP39_014460 [Pinctada imbricata]